MRDDELAADTVFTGGPILTMDATAPTAEAVAVRDGRIVAVGTADQVNTLVASTTQQVDLDGRTLMPGLIDPHMHSSMIQLSGWTDVSQMSCPTADAVFEALSTAEPTETGWVLGRQFDPSITVGTPHLDRQVLDRLVPNHPALVLESNGHVAYVNSRALQEANIDKLTPNPAAARFVHDDRGELTGRLEEPPAFLPFAKGFPLLAGETLVSALRTLFGDVASKGVTLLHDCGIGTLGGAAEFDALGLALDEHTPLRYRGMLVSDRYDEWQQLGLRPGHGDDIFRVTGMKAWSDGSNQASTGFQREPYLNTCSHGSLNYSSDQLDAIVKRAHGDGWQLGVHANGDAAIDETIESYARALAANPRDDHRHRIEHCSVLHPEQIEKMVALGLSPSCLIGHIRWWGGALRDRLLGPERTAFYDPCASALRAGLRISLHSDWNVTPIEPLRYVQDAVTRIMLENNEVLTPDERISVTAALRAVTIDAAWQCKADDVTGSLEIGKYADFAILEEDPHSVDPEKIDQIAVSQTMLAGELRYSAA